MSKIVKLRLSERYFLLFISSLFFEKESTEICSLLSEKPGPSGRFFAPDKLKNHTNERKRKEKKKKRGGRKEEKRKKQWLYSYLLYFLLWR